MKRRMTCLFLIAVLLVVSVIPIVSAETIMPRLNNTSHTSTNFTITTAGKATISAQLGKTTITCEVTVEPTKESKLDDVPKTSNTLPIALIALVVLAAGTGVYSLRTAKSNK